MLAPVMVYAARSPDPRSRPAYLVRGPTSASMPVRWRSPPLLNPPVSHLPPRQRPRGVWAPPVAVRPLGSMWVPLPGR